MMCDIIRTLHGDARIWSVFEYLNRSCINDIISQDDVILYDIKNVGLFDQRSAIKACRYNFL